MNFLGANRLRIVEYFDKLKAKVDVCVETFIAVHHQEKELETRLNQVRAEWLEEIAECEKFNLSELEDKELKLEDEDLFKRFIFEFKVAKTEELIDMRLIAIDTYIPPGKVECFQAAMLAVNKDKYVYNMLVEETCFEKLCVNFEEQDSKVCTT
jgi:hypothetical protein